MRNAAIAALVSVALHAALAAVLAFVLSSNPAPEVSVSLDLANVELSFAEQEDASAPTAVPSAPADAPPPAKPPPPPDAEAPTAGDVPVPSPPTAEDARRVVR
ncbi:MAG: hypothetical protein IKE55_12505, partial [Kiritimatiellae bacterium]|nr:hypothetical protein [Kiritimatiellia bacterium]